MNITAAAQALAVKLGPAHNHAVTIRYDNTICVAIRPGKPLTQTRLAKIGTQWKGYPIVQVEWSKPWQEQEDA